MKVGTARAERAGFGAILSQLTPKEGVLGGYLVTRSREEYDRLVRAALQGSAPENVKLGRKGLSLDRELIIPPDSILCCTEQSITPPLERKQVTRSTKILRGIGALSAALPKEHRNQFLYLVVERLQTLPEFSPSNPETRLTSDRPDTSSPAVERADECRGEGGNSFGRSDQAEPGRRTINTEQ